MRNGKFNWALSAAAPTGFGQDRSKAFLLEIEESEDKLSEAIMLLKQAQQGEKLHQKDIDLILQEIASAQDKVRRLRNLLKGKF